MALTLKDAEAAAAARSGVCLSTVYRNNREKLRWRCAQKHEWDACLKSVRTLKSWCPYCVGRGTLDKARKIAQTRNGECLSTVYVNVTTKLIWRCKHGHEWEATMHDVDNHSSWCPECAGHTKITIDDAKALAVTRGGKCHSTSYTRSDRKLVWECAAGHRWEATFGNVKRNQSWCPYCKHKSEAACRTIFEGLLGRAFPKVRPEWLEGLELDGYCQDLRLAFEYNGEQHYKEVPHWHRSEERSLKTQQLRDARKLEVCDDNWVTVVVIPYTIKDKEAFIRKELSLLGYLEKP